MSADDRGQWPFGITTGKTRGDLAPVIVQAAAQTKADCIDLLAMLKRSTHHVASVALMPVDEETRHTALTFVREATALIRRIEGKR